MIAQNLKIRISPFIKYKKVQASLQAKILYWSSKYPWYLMNFNFFKNNNKSYPLDYAVLKADMHAHLLPGIDDGAVSMQNTLELISSLKHLGYTTLITTPHIRWDMFKNTPDGIQKQLDLVRAELSKNKIDIALHAAAEYYLDDYVSRLLKTNQPLLTLKGNMVLVEFSFMHLSGNMKEVLFDVQMAGYQPVIAHPERYTYLHKNYEALHEFKENGCMFQLNLLSLSSQYGKVVLEMANYLADHDFYDFAGTDLHHRRHLEALKSLKVSEKIHTLLTGDRLLNKTLS